MSIWVQGRQEGRGRARYSVSVPFQAITLLAAIACAFWAGAFMHSPDAFCTLAVVSLASGLALIAAAKMSLFRRGVWSSWGAGLMARPFRICYRLGYILLAAGMAVFLVRLVIAV